ncbi:MAG: DUF3467 domain-containing protein [Planctomycetota bacterium]
MRKQTKRKEPEKLNEPKEYKELNETKELKEPKEMNEPKEGKEHTQEKPMEYENQGKFSEETSPEKPIEEQARDQTGQKRIRLDVDERNLKTSYTNGFRTAATAEEVLLDFGLNYVQPTGQQGTQRKIVFQANERIIMNYYSAKRLAITLSQIVRRHEQQFGELELNAAKRRSGQT